MATKKSELAQVDEIVLINSPNKAMQFATKLADLIVENNLYTIVNGKKYVNVEGWQVAGAFTGTYPIVESLENLSSGTNYKYRAEVSIRNENGDKVGYGVAICTNKEPGKHNFAEYAVASMAQTRAIGKAYRMKIGWLLKIAGYETTPAEEMPAEAEVINRPNDNKDQFEISKAKIQLSMSKDLDELKKNWNALGDELKKNKEVIKCANELKKKLGGNNE